MFVRPAIALGAVALIAFNPQFMLVSSSISNDNLIILLSMLMIWLAIRIAQSGMTTRRTLIMAVLAAAAVLTKLSAALLILVLLVALLIARTPWRKWFSTLLIVGAIGLLLTGWWFLRNLELYGEPTGIRMWQQIWGWENVAVNSSDVGVALQNFWTSDLGTIWLGPNCVAVRGLLGFIGHQFAQPDRSCAESLRSAQSNWFCTRRCEFAGRRSARPEHSHDHAWLGAECLTGVWASQSRRNRRALLVSGHHADWGFDVLRAARTLPAATG